MMLIGKIFLNMKMKSNVSNCNILKPGTDLWKFNNSLIQNETLTNTIKKFIQNVIKELNTKLL